MGKKMTERVFRGGIQRGTVATDAEAAAIDKQLRKINRQLLTEFDIPDLTWQPKLYKHQQPTGNESCAPDGGIWLYKDQVIFASEAKKQGSKGNAIDRWYRPFNTLKLVNPDFFYVTFARGAGVLEGNPIYNTLYQSVEGKYNTIRQKSDKFPHFDNNSVFLNVDGFDDNFIKEKIRTILTLALSKYTTV